MNIFSTSLRDEGELQRIAKQLSSKLHPPPHHRQIIEKKNEEKEESVPKTMSEEELKIKRWQSAPDLKF